MPAKICQKCGKSFADTANYNRHQKRKTPCVPILDKEDLPEEKKESPHRCKFCGHAFSTGSNLARHMKKSCRIAPRVGGDPDGMEKLYEHTLRKQMAVLQAQLAQQQAKIDTLEALTSPSHDLILDGQPIRKCHAEGVGSAGRVGHQGPSPVTVADRGPRAAIQKPLTKIAQTGVVTNVAAGGTSNTIQDNSSGKTINSITINVFGRENLERVTKPQVFDILRGLGHIGPSENLKVVCERAIIQTAMIIFSDPAHPEDITCYLPNKRGDSALVHGEGGWEVQPVGLVVSPMVAQSIETLFRLQPAPDPETPEKDVKWMSDECERIMRYFADNESTIKNEPPVREMRGILIRNKEHLQQVLAKLPVAGAK